MFAVTNAAEMGSDFITEEGPIRAVDYTFSPAIMEVENGP